MVYRRTRDRMPAHDSEVQEALDEGIRMKWLSTVKHADEGTLLIEKMELDASGFPQPTGEMETLAADSLVLALGQDADLALLDGLDGITVTHGVVDVDASMMTGRPGLFAGGDMVPSDRTVTVAVGHGKLAARHIDAWLRGTTHAPAPKPALAAFDNLTPWYYSDAPHRRAAAAGGCPTHGDVRRGRPGSRRGVRAVRGKTLPVVRQLLRLRQLLRGLPRQRGAQGRCAGAGWL